MAENTSSKQNQKSDIHGSTSPNVIDLLLGKEGEKVVDSETLIKETQKRVWAALKKGYEYAGTFEESEEFLRKNVFTRVDMVVLYVDLVGSTSMTLELPEEKIATIISSFAQEMANVIRQHNGYVLKFVGDAVVGYFVAKQNSLITADNAVTTAKSMITVIEKGINPILNQYDYPDLMVKIGVDFGNNLVVRYGSDKEKSPVDLLGPAMNIAAKIQSLARPNQILIGDDVYTRLHPSTQKTFERVIWKNSEWKYRSRVTGEIYQVYEYKG
ncbi:MAG: adenylate/guanylate cyclase domain-containing protein [Nitrosopumilaceae archaeon]